MSENNKDLPQFSTAEYAPNTPAVCAGCRNAISGTYFSINGAPVCPECTRRIQEQIPRDSHGAFVRASVFGIAGALVGLALYVGFALVTGIVIGWASVAVGFIVGKAMSLGSGGVGGRRYQIVAVLLTYLAVSMSAVPIALYESGKHSSDAQQPASRVQPSIEVRPTDAPAQPNSAQPGEPMTLGHAIGVLALLGIASPFLELEDPAHGII